jgi:hypothetical protein
VRGLVRVVLPRREARRDRLVYREQPGHEYDEEDRRAEGLRAS